MSVEPAGPEAGPPAALTAFLACPTPASWLEAAAGRLPELLLDHANCEKKAASTALSMMFRYPQHAGLADTLSRLAREELRHFEQVQGQLAALGIAYRRVPSSRYANALRTLVREAEPGRLVDLLICGAFIEARSCERFAALVPHLEGRLAQFYRRLLASEARHFERYLTLAEQFSDRPIGDRLAAFRAEEGRLVSEPDPQFAFHSGPPTGGAGPQQR